MGLPKTPFSSCVAPAVTHVAHAADDVVVLQELLVLGAGEQRAAIGVQDHWATIRSLPTYHHDGLQHQMPILHRCHRSADDLVWYRSSKAHRYRQPILLHVVNHATDHRGHVAGKFYYVGLFPRPQACLSSLVWVRTGRVKHCPWTICFKVDVAAACSF